MTACLSVLAIKTNKTSALIQIVCIKIQNKLINTSLAEMVIKVNELCRGSKYALKCLT